MFCSAAFTDASCTTFMLTHWARDRHRGPQLELEALVKSQACDPARLYGWTDRGTLEVGMRADLNVIDHEQLRIHRPEVAHDLPSGAARWLQRSSGYTLTMCKGEVTFEEGVHTGATPGRLIRNPSTAAKRAAGTNLVVDRVMLRALREGGRGGFDIKAGVDRSDCKSTSKAAVACVISQEFLTDCMWVQTLCTCQDRSRKRFTAQRSNWSVSRRESSRQLGLFLRVDICNLP